MGSLKAGGCPKLLALLRGRISQLRSTASSFRASSGFSLPPVLTPPARFSLAPPASRDEQKLGTPPRTNRGSGSGAPRAEHVRARDVAAGCAPAVVCATVMLLQACGEKQVDVFTASADSLAATPSSEPTEPTTTIMDAAAEPAPVPEPVMSGDVKIDDFEDGDTQTLFNGAWWYVTNDGTSWQELEAARISDRPGSEFALHSAGEGYSIWGALIGVDIGGESGVFDAGWTDALRFWAKSAQEMDVVAVVILQDNSSLRTTITLRTEWTEHVIHYDEFRFSGDDDARVDPSRLRHFQLSFGLEPFDIYLDDAVLLDL